MVTKKRIIILTVAIFLSVVCVVGVVSVVMQHSYAQSMISAIQSGDDVALQMLVEKHPKAINTSPTILPLWVRKLADSSAVYYPLHVACELGRYDMVELLLAHGARVNVQDDLLHDTPLLVCLRGNASNKYEVARLLIQNGADVTLQRRYNDDYDALGALVCGSSPDFTVEEKELFQQMLSMVDASSYDYGNLLEDIILLDRTCALPLLVDGKGIDINQYDCYDSPPLIYACRLAKPSIEMIELLLEYGAERSLKDSYNKTAYDYLVESGHIDIAELLQP